VDYTPFAGMSVKGWPKTVLLRGEILVRDGTLLGSKGFGQYIKRKIKIQE
jgi:dihydropyrimidinase